jgi:transposase-like protein
MLFKSILELMQKLPDEKTCREYFAKIRWGDKVICPHCQNDKCYTLANNRYKCSACRRSFTVKVGTIFENSKLSLQKWFSALYLLSCSSKGLSSITLAKQIGVRQATAWFMLHRIREAIINAPETLTGQVEIDETFIGGKERNKHRDKKIKEARGGNGKAIVFGMLERDYMVQTFVVKDRTEKTLIPLIEKHIDDSAVIFSDEFSTYTNLIDHFKDHKVVCHSNHNYKNGIAHTNTIEGFWGLCKRAIIGIYHSISVKYLQRYMHEFSFRYNERECSPTMLMNKLLFYGINRRLTYRQLTGSE